MITAMIVALFMFGARAVWVTFIAIRHLRNTFAIMRERDFPVRGLRYYNLIENDIRTVLCIWKWTPRQMARDKILYDYLFS
jgi:hypothetical protein